MLTLGAIVPHSPLLAPNIGKEKRDALTETLRAYREREERMYTAGVETHIIISPHAPAFPDAFSANLSPAYRGTLAAFGDHETEAHDVCDLLLIEEMQLQLRRMKHLPFVLTTSEELDYAFTIPLLFLTRHLKSFRIIPLSPSLLTSQAHADFGSALRDILDESATRIAVIASADLSHKLDARSPSGASVEGPAFDAMIRSKTGTMDLDALIAMDADAVTAAGQCGYRPILMLLGCFQGMNVHATELAYEAPFGVGYLTTLIEPT
jgi:aromatic ring-opening dioxygenase LigB subunit